jgi:general secretion pathway protein K
MEWRSTVSGAPLANVPHAPTDVVAYTPRGAKFPVANELALVRDIPASVTGRALRFLTVYSNLPQINILEAEPEVLAALPGMSADRVQEILSRRQMLINFNNGDALLPMLGNAKQYATTKGSRALRVAIHIAFDDGRNEQSEVVILVFDQGERPYSVLSWRDGFDQPYDMTRGLGQ